MGKRKSSKPPPKKVKPKLDVAFSCPFCNSDKSVTATMDWNNEVNTSLSAILDSKMCYNTIDVHLWVEVVHGSFSHSLAISCDRYIPATQVSHLDMRLT